MTTAAPIEENKKLPYEFTGEEKRLECGTIVQRIGCIVDNHSHAKKGELGGMDRK